MAHPYSRNRNRYRGRIPCFLVDFGPDPDPDLDLDSGCHNENGWPITVFPSTRRSSILSLND
jgi:hypothetical protein